MSILQRLRIWNTPNYKQRKDYAVITGILFIIGLVAYGSLTYNYNIQFPDTPENLFSGAFSGGLLLGGYCSGIIIFKRLLPHMSHMLKIISCVLFLFTMCFIGLIGIFPFIPYYVYNIVMLIIEKRKQPARPKTNSLGIVIRFRIQRIVFFILLIATLYLSVFYKVFILQFLWYGMVVYFGVFLYFKWEYKQALKLLTDTRDPFYYLDIISRIYRKKVAEFFTIPGYFFAGNYEKTVETGKELLRTNKNYNARFNAIAHNMQAYFFMGKWDEIQSLKMSISTLSSYGYFKEQQHKANLNYLNGLLDYFQSFKSGDFEEAKRYAKSLPFKSIPFKLLNNYYIIPLPIQNAKIRKMSGHCTMRIIKDGNKLMIVEIVQEIMHPDRKRD